MQTKQIKLLKTWRNGDQTYDKGTVLEVDAAFALGMVEGGYADVETKALYPDKRDSPAWTRQVWGAAGQAHGDYKNFGTFLSDVMNAGRAGGITDKLARLECSKSLGSDELATVEDSIGGFLVPPEFRGDLFQTKGFDDDFVRGGGALVIPTLSTEVSIPAEVDNDRQTSLFGGLVVQRTGERTQMKTSRPKFELIKLRPTALTSLVYVTDRMLQGATSSGAILGTMFQRATLFTETQEWLNGSGVGESLGVLNSGALYEVAKETSQVAGSIVWENVLKMRQRQFDYRNSVWLCTAAGFSELMRMVVKVQNIAGTENVGGGPTIIGFGGGDAGPPERLLGRPLIFTEHMKALGTKGDFMNVAWNHYLIAETEIKQESSIHVRFDANETAFRIVKQMDGQPWWRVALTGKNGFVRSPFVVLAERT